MRFRTFELLTAISLFVLQLAGLIILINFIWRGWSFPELASALGSIVIISSLVWWSGWLMWKIYTRFRNGIVDIYILKEWWSEKKRKDWVKAEEEKEKEQKA